MGFLRRAGGPLLGSARNLPHARGDVFRRATYENATSPSGLPMIQLNLTFQRNFAGVTNPDMSLAVLLDRSGSMSETYRDGHLYNAASTILNYVAAAGGGYDLVFYNHTPSFAGHIRTTADLQNAIAANPPGGGTRVTEAIQGAIERYKKKAGLYIIVVTDGEFSDKDQVQKLVVQTLLPQLTPTTPFAYRLHFIGAGEGVDKEFLEQLEAAASGTGVQLVKQHHHAHLRHSHDSMLDELDAAFVGISSDFVLGERAPGQNPVVTRVGNITAARWFDGPQASVGFVPKHSQLGIEYAPQHPASLDAVARFAQSAGIVEIPLEIPLPRVTAIADVPSAAAVAPKKSRFHLPWHHATPEEEAAKQAEAQRRAEQEQQVIQVRQAEAQRQTADLQALGRGGIPTMAQRRLAEARGEDAEHATFSSDLSPDEAALLRRNGYRALGQVCGSAMYHVGTAYASAYQDCEVTVLSNAYNEATRLAVSRMQQEATMIGAHGVVGVRFDIVRREWSAKSIEVQLVGTAVAGTAQAPGTPWLSDLSGQEWFALHRAGYDPVGFVYGHCTWFILTTQMDEWGESSYINQELGHFSDALRQCRNRANGMVQGMARQMHAGGVVGVHLSRHLEEIRLTGAGDNPAYEREHHNLTLSLIGTAIRLRPDAPKTIRATGNVLSLLDGRITPRVITTTAAKFE
jgi:uncharacterized protein YbjQ (UPF0145 family)